MQYRISKEDINAMPVICFEGEIEEVYSAERLDEVVEELWKHELVGFDTESRPAFKKGSSYPISVIQLVTNDHAYLIRNQFSGISESLSDYFQSDSHQKVGLALRDDVKKLHELGLEAASGLIDLSRLAQAKGILQTGARALTARYMQRRLSKNMQTTNWAEKILSEKQRLYAATDAWICLHLLPLLQADKTDYRSLAEAYEKEQEALGNTDF